MNARYHEFRQLDLPAIEQEILRKWEEEGTFRQTVEGRSGARPFVFYEGPPSANGMPGIHHVISRTLKDLVCRYKTMQGFRVERKGGWDTHGLPIELGVEKELGITKEDIGKTISVADYNAKCREAVLRYKDKWDELTRRMGYWVDLENPYITFTNEYIESLWWCLKQLYDKGLLYKSVSIQPYSPGAGTGLSSHELNQPGTYRNVKDTSIVALFRAQMDAAAQQRLGIPEGGPVYYAAWTTTPWTLPSNLGLTVGHRIQYALARAVNPYSGEEQRIIMAEAALGRYFKGEGDYTVEASFPGSALEEQTYEQLLPFASNSPERIVELTPGARPFRILLGDFVTTEDGTGIVHTSPAFGADDYKVGAKYGIGILTLVDREGKFVEGTGEFAGRFIKDYKSAADYSDVNVDIAVRLKKEGRALKVEKYEHNYPHCWRTDKPIVYYPLDAWFIRTTALRDRMVELNNTIRWKPASTGTGRFGNWLENMVDWNLSRSRFWGTPLPIWRTEDGTEEKCIGSIEELNREIRKAGEVLGGEVNKNYFHDGILDLHKPYVDEVVLVSETGRPMRREPDLIDVWFDSGAMPYAQWHYPFEGRDKFKDAFPADFIAEGVDQTRGWFYTLHALGVMLFDSVAYKTVVSNGLVLDKNGNKMSKRLGNVVDPFKTIGDFGADATRWYLITNASPWDNLKFDLEGIREVQRKFFGTLYNTYQFFSLYANVDGFRFSEAPIPLGERPEIDRWILSALHSLVEGVTAAFEDYEPTTAGRLIEDFVDSQLSNWYVRLCRRRFWKGEYESDKIAAYQTLYECLETVLALMAPISPFFSDALYRRLNAVTERREAPSVHGLDYPKVAVDAVDPALEERMRLAQDACSLILSLRKKANIKVRQPLQKVLIPVLNRSMEQQLQQVAELIRAEVNVKELVYLSDTEGFIRKKIKPNFIALGKRLGGKMKAVSAALSGMDQAAIAQFEKEGRYIVPVEGGEEVTLALTDVEISSEDVPGWSVATKGALTVALDISVTPELVAEGNAREFVNRIQKIRKDRGFEVTDRIDVEVGGAGEMSEALATYNNYIRAEILADDLRLATDLDGGTEIEVNDLKLKVNVLKKG